LRRRVRGGAARLSPRARARLPTGEARLRLAHHGGGRCRSELRGGHQRDLRHEDARHRRLCQPVHRRPGRGREPSFRPLPGERRARGPAQRPTHPRALRRGLRDPGAPRGPRPPGSLRLVVLSAAPFELEPDRATRERWLEILASLVQDHLDALEHAPAVGVQGKAAEDIVRASRVPVPEEPLPGGIEAAAGILRRAALASYNTPGPGYLAYIPGGGLFASALADLVANALNRYTGISAPAPAFVALEAEVLAWLAREFGYGPEAAGLFTTGGSLANWSAIVAARHAAFGDSGDFRAAVAYTSSQAHHSVAKALRL